MVSRDDTGRKGLSRQALAVVLGLIVLLGLLVLAVVVALPGGFGASPSDQAQTPEAPAAAAPASSASSASSASAAPSAQSIIGPANQSAAQAATDAATVMVEQGVVRFYFASGKSDLAAGAGDALGDVVKAAGAGRTLVIAGFHDATGDAARNATLARQRALAVRDALKAAGVPERQIEVRKPELATSGSDAEARRVDITLR